MQLIFCISKLDNSGPARGLVALANGLSQSHKVKIFYFKNNEKQSVNIKQSINANIEVLKYNRQLSVDLQKSREKTTIISMCFLSDFLVPIVFMKMRKAIYIRGNLFRNYWYDYRFSGVILAVIHYLMTLCYDKCFVLNKEEYSRVSKINKNTFIVPNCIDEQVMNWEVSEQSLEFDFIFVGNLNERKQPELYIRAVMALAKKCEGRLKAAVVGGGPLENELKRVINTQDMNDCIQMIGKVDDVYSYLRRSSVFVLPSLSEGTPRAAMEALANGNIIVLRDVANNADLLTVGETGFLFKNDRDLLTAMEDALVLSKKQQYRGRNLLPQKFRQSNVITKLEDVL